MTIQMNYLAIIEEITAYDHLIRNTQVYPMCARPTLLYAVPVWTAASRTHLDRLQKMQNKFLRTF